MEKTVKLLIGLIITSVLICACAVVSFADNMSYNEAQTAIAQLQDYAKEYKANNKVLMSENRLVMNYIRSGAYNGTVWTLAAGKVNDGFVEFVENKNDDGVTNVKELRTNQLSVEISSGISLDIPHLFAAMECCTNGVKNFGGWYGDLAQVMVEVAKKEDTTYSVKASYEAAKQYINKENTLFNPADVVSDLEAVAIMNILNRGYLETVSESFSKLNTIINNYTNRTAISFLCADFLSSCLKLDPDASYTQIATRLALVTVKDAALVTALGVLDKQRVSSAVRIGSRLAFAEFLYKQVNNITNDNQLPSDRMRLLAKGQIEANLAEQNENAA